MGIYIDKIQFTTDFWSGYSSHSIQDLHLHGKFSYFNLDNFFNLKRLSLQGTLDESFNFELFKNLCKQLESLIFRFTDIDFKALFKLFDGYHFPNLQYLTFNECLIKNVNKHYINSCHLETIEDETFSNLKQLRHLGLPGNQIRFIGKNAFFNLKNLEVLNLANNELTHIDREFIGIGLESSVEIRLDTSYLTI